MLRGWPFPLSIHDIQIKSRLCLDDEQRALMRIWEDSFQTFFYFFFSSTRRHPFSFHKLRTTSVGFLLKRSKTNHFQSFWYQYLIFRHSHVESCLEYGFYLYTRTCMKPNIMENTLVIVGRVQPCESIWAISAMWDSEIMGDFPFLKRKKKLLVFLAEAD